MRPEVWVDFETGGVKPWVHSPLSIGAIAVVNGKIVDEFYRNIRIEPLVVTADALKTNKLDLTIPGIATKEEFKKQWNGFMNKNFYEYGRVRPNKDNMPFFCGQNTVFDRPFLHELLETDFDLAYYHRIDTMIFANILRSEGLLPGVPDLKLETMSNYFRLPVPEMFHNSLCDIKQTYLVYKCLKRVMRGVSVDTIRGEMVDQPTLPFDAADLASPLDAASLGIKAD